MTAVNDKGAVKVFDFTGLDVPTPMQLSLARVFAGQAAKWNRLLTAEKNWRALEAFAAFLQAQGQPAQDLDQLPVSTVKLLRNNFLQSASTRGHLIVLRTLLRQDPRLKHGAVAEELARTVRRIPSTRQSMEDREHEQVRLAAQREFRSALLRIRENTLILERYRRGELVEGSSNWTIGRILEQVATTGDVPRTLSSKIPSVSKATSKALGGSQPVRTWGRLFLTRSEVIALAVLMTDQWGWNMSMYDGVPAPVREPSAGETRTITYQVQVEKHRAGVGRWWDTVNITDSGAHSDGRLITQALEATAHGRTLTARLAPGTDLLMVYRLGQVGRPHKDGDRPPKVGPLGFGLTPSDAVIWRKRHGLPRSPFQPLRRTTVVDEGQPLQHKQGTHQSVYVFPDQRVQRRSRTVFADGAEAAYQEARELTFQGRLTTTPEPGHEETVTSDCVDESTSRWPAPGGGCGAEFMTCLACENARVHHGHHPRLALLYQTLTSLRGTLPDRHWVATWREHMLRLENLRERVGETVFDAAVRRVTDRDRMIIDHLLKGNLNP
ncbi:hypothetical protein [Streptomyces anulatus]|uniref:hypothetical protein n=1 Tax=Streptomyces anulatus TaxID=1892 RepID=UPI0038663FD9